MNAKKLVVILIAFAFSLIMVFSCVALLSIKKIQVDFSVSSYSSNQNEFANQTTEEVQNLLNEYLGVSLLTVDAEQVEQKLMLHPKLEVVEVIKKFPNVLCVSIKERREVYKFNYNGKDYILDEFGFVLTDDGKTTQGTNLISLSFEDIDVSKIEVGKKIEIEKDFNNSVISTALDIVKNVGLADCIDAITLKDESNGYDLHFKTRTGTIIRTDDIMSDGLIKTQKAFGKYNTIASDYQKGFGKIEALYAINKDGKKCLRITHEYEIDGVINTDDFDDLLE